VRHELELVARLRRHDGTKLRLELVAYVSDLVPLHGVLDARIELAVGESEAPLSIEHHFALSACRSE